MIAKLITESNERSDDVLNKLEDKTKNLNVILCDLSVILHDVVINTNFSLVSTEGELMVKQEKFRAAEEKIIDIQSKYQEQMNLHITDLLKEQALRDSYLAAKTANTEMAFFENIITQITAHHEGTEIIFDVEWNFYAIQKIYSDHQQDRKYSA